MTTTPPTATTKTKGKRTRRLFGMGMSLKSAETISSLANWTLVAALVVGVLATYGIVISTKVKEFHWAQDRQKSNERIASAELETERLRKEFGPRNLNWNAFVDGMKSAEKVQLEILYVVDDSDSMEMAQQIQLACSAAGWGMPSRNPIQRPPGWSEPIAMAVDGQPNGITVVSRSPTPDSGIEAAIGAGIGRVSAHKNGPYAPPIGTVRIVVAPK